VQQAGDAVEQTRQKEDEMSWFLMVWQRFAEFGGLSRRKEYWIFTLIHLLIQVGLLVVSVGFGVARLQGIGQAFTILLMVYAVVGIVPYTACFVRRLHDTGRSGWWWLLGWAPLSGGPSELLDGLL
jgi:uncharacterized membrane protein YhaH (DUF805 family)